jgi:hypothetical protein
MFCNDIGEKMLVEIYVHIPEDQASLPVKAEKIGDNLYKILPEPSYDPEDAEWQFPPGSIVRCEPRKFEGERYLQAIERVE